MRLTSRSRPTPISIALQSIASGNAVGCGDTRAGTRLVISLSQHDGSEETRDTPSGLPKAQVTLTAAPAYQSELANVRFAPGSGHSIITSKTIDGRTGHHCLIALRIRCGSIIHSSCFSISDASRWPPAQSMFYNGY